MCKRNIVNPNPPENHYKFWQNEAMRKLGKNYADCTNEELAELMGRTKGAITTRITILRIVVRMAPTRKNGRLRPNLHQVLSE